MTARFSRAAQQSVEFARTARGHRPRLQLTEYRLNWNSSTSGVLTLAFFRWKFFVGPFYIRLPTLVEAAESRFGAFVGDRQKALHAFIADYIRMRITDFSLRQCGQLLLGSVGIGMVGQDDVGTRLGDDVAETACGLLIGFEHKPFQPIRCYVRRPVS